MKNNYNIQDSINRCKKYRLRILEISQQVTALHIAPAFSSIEILDVIYNGLMDKEQLINGKEHFIMSKGHGCIGQYVILEDLKIISKIDLDNYCNPTGFLGAHPDRGNPGIIASTGSLGHGMGMALGMAYAEKIKKTNKMIYVLLSDGELQEGSSWEAAMMAANLQLDNLVAFVDLNDFGGMDRMSNDHKAFYPLDKKFISFGWETINVNGHDVDAIFKAYNNKKLKAPLVIICKTIKGKGVSYMENVPIWHYRSPNIEEYKQAVREIKDTYEK